ncbi:hypothetical protein EC988_000115 [Linderina pennispora]|nr:hypothetical protein EC988_000115 [Linderina pennispora]
MSFSLTPKEQNRVEIAGLLGYHLDPIGKNELALLVVFAFIYAIDLLAVVFLIWNRNYPPLKSKSPMIMVGVYISFVLWFIGDLQANGIVHLSGTALTNCKAFGVWVRVLLGVCTVSSLIALRSYGLYRVFRLNQPFNGFGLYLPFIIFCGLLLIYGIISQVLSQKVTIQYVAMLDVCVYTSGYKASLFAFIWVAWVVVAVINWKIRRIKSSFNESREMAFCCLVVFAVLIFTTTMHYTHPTYPFDGKLRLVTTGLDHIACNLVWWTIMFTPMFNCVFRRKQYLRHWTKKLRDDGLQRQYDVESNTTSTSILHSTAPFGSHAYNPHDSSYMYSNSRNVDFYYGDELKHKHGKGSGQNRPDSAIDPIKYGSHSDVSLDSRRMSTHKFMPTPDPFNIQPVSPATVTTLTSGDDPFSIPADTSAEKNNSSVRRTLRRKGRQSENALQNPLVIPPHNAPHMALSSSRSALGPVSSRPPLHSPITYPEPVHTTLTWSHDDASDGLNYHLPGDRHLL